MSGVCKHDGMREMYMNGVYMSGAHASEIM